uniref:cache domain-containing protein n=1 Tax=Halarcobacter sp. TaxID=2321133 RepID=UPI003A942244
MKESSIANKILLRILIVAAIVIVIAAGVSYYLVMGMKKDIELQTQEHFELLIKERIKAKLDIGISNAVTISKNTDVIEALETNNRDLAIAALSSISNAMKNGTSFKNVKVHIHDKNVNSFLRNWKTEKYGDDLSSFRKTILEVKNTQKPLAAIEVGRAGLVLRGLAPIFNDAGEYIGSLEFIQGFNSVVKDFKADDEFLLVLMDEKLKRGNALTSQDKVGNYYISQKVIDESFKNSVKSLDFTKLINKGYLTDSSYFYTQFPIKDFQGNTIGTYLVGDHIKHVDTSFNESANLVYFMLVMMVILTLVLVFVIYYLFKKIITGGLNKFKRSFAEFLDFISFKTNTFTKPAVYTNDEVGQMLVMLNETADIFDKKLKEDMRVIGEIVLTSDKVEQGIYKCRIHATSENPMIVTLKNTINKMLDENERNMTEVVRTVSHFASDDYRDKVNINPKLKDKMLEVMQSINKLGEALGNNAKANLNNGQTLEHNSATMTASMNNLAAKANEQAASLEETAAAVEEITSITRNN